MHNTSLAFENNPKEKNINYAYVPDGTISITEGEFMDYKHLNKVDLPDGLKSIEKSAFEGCVFLQFIEIPHSVKAIGKKAFAECISLGKINIPNKIKVLNEYTFKGCSDLEEIIIPDSVISIKDYAFEGCTSLQELVIPDSVTFIGKFAFRGCSSLRKIVISDNVTIIEEGAFEGCSSLVEIVVPDKVNYIGERAFRGCSSLKQIEISNSILIDEFQDTNEYQYLILSKIYNANKKMQLMFVGDVNQAIFGTLGGKAKNKKELDLLYDTYFKSYSLTGCYRSTQQIVNLYRNFEIQATGVNSVSEIKDEVGAISYNTSISKDELTDEIAKIIRLELANGTKEEEICIIAPQWSDLFKLSKKLREQLPDISFDAPNISPIKYDPLNPLYLIAQLLFMPEGRNVTLKKKIANEILSILKDDLKINISDDIINYDIISTINRCRNNENDGILCFRYAIEQVCLLLQINIQTEPVLLEIQNQIFNKINDRVEKHNLKTDYETMSKYFGEKRGIVISTIHGVKGEEYTTVIAIGLLNGKLPHWDIICKYDKNFRIVETKKLLYVLCSRAKKNIYLFSESGYETRNGKPYTPTNELSLINWEKI